MWYLPSGRSQPIYSISSVGGLAANLAISEMRMRMRKWKGEDNHRSVLHYGTVSIRLLDGRVAMIYIIY